MSTLSTPIAGVLLTGGWSRRMGVDKATIRIGDETLATRAARVLQAVCDPVLEVGPGWSGLRAVPDEPRGRGPRSGLAAAVAELGACGPILLLGVDLPGVEPALLELVASWPGEPSAVPMQGGFPQVCCARYSAHALARMAEPGRSLKGLLEADGYTAIPEARWQRVAPADALDDVDTPEDLTRRGLGFSL